MKRKIAVVTGTRAEYGLLYWIMKAIKSSTELQLKLLATGAHLSPYFGSTYKIIEENGFRIDRKVDMLSASDSPAAVSKSMGLGLIGFAQAYEELKPDMLLVLGDRYEILAAVSAAIPFRIPVAHIHGGESTEGAFDEQIRHAVTKMSHLHFTSAEAYRQNIIKMGEEPSRVYNVGAPGLEWLRHVSYLTRDELSRELKMEFGNVILATFHPVTLELDRTAEYVKNVVGAVKRSGMKCIFTGANADPSGSYINEYIKEAARGNNNIRFVENLGQVRYLSCQKYCTMMLGNSSSGIIEAASFGLPVVNIGNRQKGRLQSGNVVNTGYSEGEILEGIKLAGSEKFRKYAGSVVNIYGDGNVASKVVEVLAGAELKKLIVKRLNYET